MLDRPTQAAFQELFTTQAAPCVTIYLPTHRRSREAAQDRVRLKNALRDVETQLRTRDFSASVAQRCLHPARQLIDDPLFWQQQRDGLALFLTARWHQIYRLKTQVNQSAVVNGRFDLRPLIRSLQEDLQAVVLSLSVRGVGLWEATAEGLAALEGGQLPQRLVEAMVLNSALRRTLQELAGQPGQSTQPDQEVVPPEPPARLQEFFRNLDGSLRVWLEEQDWPGPLIVVGPAALLELFRRLPDQSSQLLLEADPAKVSEGELHRQIWDYRSQQWHREHSEIMQRFLRARHTPWATEDIQSLVVAAQRGQVETLLVRENHRCWGSFDPGQESVALHPQRKTHSVDLLDLAAANTLLTRGRVVVIGSNGSSSQLPADHCVGGLLRYPLRH